jgi:hypothetical protein
MRPLKVAYLKKWNNWLINSPKAFTQEGNRMSPGYALVVDWISEICQELDQATIIRSFDQCGLTAQSMINYGSQLIHFFCSNKLVDNVDLADEANREMF